MCRLKLIPHTAAGYSINLGDEETKQEQIRTQSFSIPVTEADNQSMWDHLVTTSLLHYIVKEAFFNQMKEVGSVHCSELLIRLQRNKASSHQVTKN